MLFKNRHYIFFKKKQSVELKTNNKLFKNMLIFFPKKMLRKAKGILPGTKVWLVLSVSHTTRQLEHPLFFQNVYDFSVILAEVLGLTFDIRRDH